MGITDVSSLAGDADTGQAGPSTIHEEHHLDSPCLNRRVVRTFLTESRSNLMRLEQLSDLSGTDLMAAGASTQGISLVVDVATP